MQTLINYLATLNSNETQWGIWVNPENLDEFRIGQKIHQNGGVLDNYEYIGDCESLSYGFQSRQDAVKEVLENNPILLYQGKKVLFNKTALYEAYTNDALDADFENFLNAEAEKYEQQWALEKSQGKVYQLHDYFTGEEYQEDAKNRKLEAEAWQSQWESESVAQ